MSGIVVASQGEENFQSVDSLEGLLNSMASGGPSAMDISEPKLDAQMLEEFLIKKDQSEVSNVPQVEIVEQPKQKELRFRYECEGRSAGSLPGQRSDLDRKTFPTIKIHNYHGPFKVIASLVTREESPRPHPHGLVGKDCEHGFCAITASQSEKMTASFPNLGIQCVKQKEVIVSLKKRQQMGIDPYGWFTSSKVNLNKIKPKDLNYEMNVVSICFQVFIPDRGNPTDFCKALAPVVTHPIFDKKGATLHIARCDRNHGTVKGNDEIFILCDKVQREDISVIFFSEKLQWTAKAIFGPNDIHRQVAIVCRTPAFKTLKIDKPVKVQFMLERPSDKERSDPVDFTYTPFDDDVAQIGAKRKRKSANFTNYFKGGTDSGVKVENLSDNASGSCSYADHYGIATGGAPPQTGGQPNAASDVRQRLRQKLAGNKAEGLDVRLPPNDQPMQTKPRGRGRPPKRTTQLTANFGTNFGAMTTSQAGTTSHVASSSQGDVNSAVEGLLTINPELLNSIGLHTMASALASQPAPNAVPTTESAIHLFDSMQEGAPARSASNDALSEEDKAVQHILSQMPGPQGPSVEAVQNPSSVIELNSAGNWQLDGVEITDQQFAEEISSYAAKYMENTTSGDLEKVSLTELTDQPMGGDIFISEPNSPDMMVEGGVHDSVTLPFSNSIELGANAPKLNSDSKK